MTAIFAVIILFYTNSFLMKNRKKEFGLYNILGMEKRHISRVVALETLYTAVLSLAAGLALGMALDKLMFLLIAGLLVAVDATGRIRAFGPDGADLGTSEPLLAASVADPATRSQIQLVADANRAYVSGPAEDIVLEVDYRDGARIARTFNGLDPRFLQQVG